MKLIKLLEGVDKYKIFGNSDIEIKGISDDSRKIKRGYLFFALKGLHFNGNAFIKDALDSGAVAIISEYPKPKNINTVSYIRVKKVRLALSLIASNWYSNPSKHLKIIGITGTKGKTTTATLVYEFLKHSGKKVGVITTNSANIGRVKIDTGFHTTSPEPIDLQRYLSLMVKKRNEYAVLEVTSHALDQDRVAGINFFISVLTNLTHEHLDYHKTFEKYRGAKMKLFKGCKIAVLNIDDPSFERFKEASGRAKIISYGVKLKSADYYIENFFEKNKRLVFNIKTEKDCISLKSKLTGDFNLSNIIAAIAAVREAGVDWDDIKNTLLNFKGIEGRLEKVNNSKGIDIYIDFAHSPDSLEKLLIYLKKNTKEKLICVFGCASERDILKRPIMGGISTRLANISIFTAEDPRCEPVEKIIAEIEKGVNKNITLKFDSSCYSVTQHGNRKRSMFTSIADREKAILFAIKIAQKGDTVVICGKGHEKSMNIGGVEYPWSDREVTERALKSE